MGLPLFSAHGRPRALLLSLRRGRRADPAARGPIRASRRTRPPSSPCATTAASSWWATARRPGTTSPAATCARSSRPTASRRIAISGSAARGIEFIRMAQLSFEHYEKMTDSALSLEGKANYLSPIIQRNNLTSPLPVMPLLAGWDASHRVGRIFEYDGAGRLLRAARLRDDRIGLTLRREHAAPGLSRRPRPRGARSTWARWRSTRPATTTRAPGDRTSCATSSR